MEAELRWPVQLAEALAERKRIQLAPVKTVARNGWRTDNLINALEAESLATNFGLVSLLIGVNDQYQGFSVSGFRERFGQLLRRAINHAGDDPGKVFTVSIPDYAYTPMGSGNREVSQQIDRFNEAIEAEAVAVGYGIPVFNVTDISREGLREATLVAGDGLHPSGKQYRRWVTEVLLARVTALVGDR